MVMRDQSFSTPPERSQYERMAVTQYTSGWKTQQQQQHKYRCQRISDPQCSPPPQSVDVPRTDMATLSTNRETPSLCRKKQKSLKNKNHHPSSLIGGEPPSPQMLQDTNSLTGYSEAPPMYCSLPALAAVCTGRQRPFPVARRALEGGLDRQKPTHWLAYEWSPPASSTSSSLKPQRTEQMPLKRLLLSSAPWLPCLRGVFVLKGFWK